MTDRAYRISWMSLSLALVAVLLTLATLFLTDDGHPGWDQLPEQFAILFFGLLIAISFLEASFVSGLYAWRQRKIALLWVVPGGVLAITTAIGLFLFLVWYLADLYWGPF